MGEQPFRNSGIELIGFVPWGTHFCQFYAGKQDLIDTLVPYFKAGLENNEFCMWITAEPLQEKEAEDALRKAVPNLDEYLEIGQIEIISHARWYLLGGSFDQDRVLKGWVDKLNEAQRRGFDGLRLTGNTFWLEKSDWQDFYDYEAAVNNVIGNYRMLAICAYALDKCGASEIADVIANHQFALMKREGKWTVIESADYKQARQEVIAANEELQSANRELRLITEGLRRSERRYRSFIDLTSQFAWVTDANGLVVEDIPALRAFTGQTYEEARGAGWAGALHPDDVQRTLEIWDKAVSTKTQYEIEYRMRRHDGVYRLLLAKGVPISDDDGNVVEWVGTCIDITERKAAEEAQRENERRLARSQEIAHLGSWELDLVKNDLTWSDEVYRIFGLQPQEFGATYQAFLDAVHPDDRASVDEAYSGSIRDGKSTYEIEHRVVRRSTGEIRWVRERCEHFQDSEGTIIRSIGMVLDITDSKHAEQELAQIHAEAESRAAELETFIHSMNDGVALFDMNGRVLLANQTAKDVLGIIAGASPDKWRQRYRLYSLDGEPVPAEQYASRRALRGEVSTDVRRRFVTPKREGVISVNASPVRDAAYRIIGAIIVFRDISAQVEMEAKQAELYEREHRIADVLQKALIPESAYNIPGCEIATKYEPALTEAEVGGDFYDVFDLGEGRVGILIGDVAGKGLAAAIRVAAARHSIRSYAYLDPRPSRALTLANDALCRDLSEASAMLTAFFAVVDTRVGVITCANGGHETPLIKRKDGRVEEIEIAGRALGVMPGWTYSEESRVLWPGDAMVMITDGITEARRDSSALFGLEGVKSHLSRTLGVSVKKIAASILAAAKEYSGGNLRDDAAVVALSIKASATKRK